MPNTGANFAMTSGIAFVEWLGRGFPILASRAKGAARRIIFLACHGGHVVIIDAADLDKCFGAFFHF